jgi:hypothetical protein
VGLLGLVDHRSGLAGSEWRVAEHQFAGDQLVGGAQQPQCVGVRQHLVDQFDRQARRFEQFA